MSERGTLQASAPSAALAVAMSEVEEVVEVDVDVDSFIDRVDPSRVFRVSGAGEELTVGELRRRIPVVAPSKSELLKGSFNAEEGYLLSRVDGIYDVATVASLCPFRETVALERLADLAARGILNLQKP